jgi:hypothetical protein
MVATTVLAHGGGAPEAATVLIPLIVVIAFIVHERKNVRKQREQQEGDAKGAGDQPPS